MNLSYEKTKKLLSLVRRELRGVDPWGNAIANDNVQQLRAIETELLEWMNNGAEPEPRCNCNDPEIAQYGPTAPGHWFGCPAR